MSSSLPSRREAWQRLIAAQPPAWVLRHCLAVEALAVAMALRARAQGLDVDVDVVARGALLHDIGRSVTQDLHHAHVGAELLRNPPPWPDAVVRVVETHTGAGITPDEAAVAGLPVGDYVPRSLAQRIVAHADNLYAGDKRQSLQAVLAKYDAQGLQAAGRRIARLHAALGQELACDLDTLEPASLAAP